MQGNAVKILVLLAALAALPGRIFAASGGPSKHVVQLAVAPESSDKASCAKIVDSMAFHLRSTQRFTVADETAVTTDHKITVSCVGASMQLTWVAIGKSKGKGSTKLVPTLVRKIKVRRDGALMNDLEASGLLGIKELLRELPWEGEVIGLQSIRAKAKEGGELILGDPKKGYEQDFVSLSIGYLEAESVGNCVAFDLGTLQATKGRPKFIKIGEGLIIDTRPFSVEAEAFLKKDAASADKIYFRIQGPDAKASQVKRFTRRCKERVGEGAAGALILAGNKNYPGLLSKETIELNMVRQRSGIYLGTFGTTNGLKIPYLASAYVHNYLEIGDYFGADMRVYRTLLTTPYVGEAGGKKSELTFADAFGGFRYSVLDYTFLGGLGLMIDKMNIPYQLVREVDVDTGAVKEKYGSTRNYRIRSALLVTALADWDDYWAGLRYAFSFSQLAPYQQLNADFNLRITDTWFIGWDLLVERIYPTSAGEPGGSLINFGGHVGFTIRRAKPMAEKRIE